MRHSETRSCGRAPRARGDRAHGSPRPARRRSGRRSASRRRRRCCAGAAFAAPPPPWLTLRRVAGRRRGVEVPPRAARQRREQQRRDRPRAAITPATIRQSGRRHGATTVPRRRARARRPVRRRRMARRGGRRPPARGERRRGATVIASAGSRRRSWDGSSAASGRRSRLGGQQRVAPPARAERRPARPPRAPPSASCADAAGRRVLRQQSARPSRTARRIDGATRDSGGGVVLDVAQQHRDRLGVAERRRAGEHLERDDAERVEVGPRADARRPAPARAPCTRACRSSCRSRSAACSSESSALAIPKSAILTPPSAVTSTFSGLRSRWTIPCACACASPLSIASSTPRDVRERQRADTRPQRPVRQVLHRDVRDAVGLEVLVDGDEVRVAQRRRPAATRARTVARSRGRRREKALSSLSATSRRRSVWHARETVAVPPRPISSRISYRSTVRATAIRSAEPDRERRVAAYERFLLFVVPLLRPAAGPRGRCRRKGCPRPRRPRRRRARRRPRSPSRRSRRPRRPGPASPGRSAPLRTGRGRAR